MNLLHVSSMGMSGGVVGEDAEYLLAAIRLMKYALVYRQIRFVVILSIKRVQQRLSKIDAIVGLQAR